MQRGPELVFDMVKSVACPSAPCMKESKKRGIRRDLKGGEIIYCCVFLICWTYAHRPAQAFQLRLPSLTISLSYILIHTHRQNKKKQKTSKAIRYLIYLWIHNLPTKPFSILWVRENESLTGQQLKGHYLFIRQKINQNSAIYILKWKMCRK